MELKRDISLLAALLVLLLVGFSGTDADDDIYRHAPKRTALADAMERQNGNVFRHP